MPNRIIKDSIRLSEKINSLTDFQFRLWVSLITYVDDYGRGDARPAVIKGTCFPLRDRVTLKDIDAALQSLAGAGCVGLYTVDGKPYLYFPRWESHQVIRNKKSKFPAPNGGSQAIEFNCNQSSANVSVIQSESESESERESENILSFYLSDRGRGFFAENGEIVENSVENHPEYTTPEDRARIAAMLNRQEGCL